MGQEDAERLRLALEAYATNPQDTSLFTSDAVHAELEWDISAHPLPDWPDTGTGKEAFRRHLDIYVAGWRNYRTEVREVIDAGDEVVTVLHETASVRGSDLALERDLLVVWAFTDGLLSKARVFRTRKEALAAAGVGAE